MNRSWNFDQKPTGKEKMIGVIGSFLLCTAGGTSFWFSVTFLKNTWINLITGAFTVFSAYLVYHFLFTLGRKPSRREINTTAGVFITIGSVSLIFSILEQNIQKRLMLILIGLGGIGGGIQNLRKNKN